MLLINNKLIITQLNLFGMTVQAYFWWITIHALHFIHESQDAWFHILGHIQQSRRLNTVWLAFPCWSARSQLKCSGFKLPGRQYPFCTVSKCRPTVRSLFIYCTLWLLWFILTLPHIRKLLLLETCQDNHEHVKKFLSVHLFLLCAATACN